MPFHLSPGGARPVGTSAAIALAAATLVAAAAAASIFLSTALDAWTAIAAAGPAGPADGILLVAALGGVLLSLWLGLGMTLSALSALPGAVGQACRRLAGRVAPAAVRKVVAFILGTTLTAALVPGSAAAGTGHDAHRPGAAPASRHVTEAIRGAVDVAPDASFRFVGDPIHDADDDTDEMEAAPPPVWSTERPVPREGSVAHTVHAAPAGGVVVRRGDTLWSIAARHLHARATAADIDAECHRGSPPTAR